jgi:hypothetical protein
MWNWLSPVEARVSSAAIAQIYSYTGKQSSVQQGDGFAVVTEFLGFDRIDKQETTFI